MPKDIDYDDYEFVTHDTTEESSEASKEVVDIVSLSYALIELYAAPVLTANKTFGKDKHIEILMSALKTATDKYSVTSKLKIMDTSKLDIYVDQVDN